MQIEFTSEDKIFTSEDGRQIPYVARNIVIDGTPYKVTKNDGRVFDFQFKEYINKGVVDE